MTPERLDEIRASYILWDSAVTMVPELIVYVAELTRQRDSARRMVVDAGVFQTHEGTEYLPDPDYPWRADPVGPVAWDVQEQQR